MAHGKPRDGIRVPALEIRAFPGWQPVSGTEDLVAGRPSFLTAGPFHGRASRTPAMPASTSVQLPAKRKADSVDPDQRGTASRVLRRGNMAGTKEPADADYRLGDSGRASAIAGPFAGRESADGSGHHEGRARFGETTHSAAARRDRRDAGRPCGSSRPAASRSTKASTASSAATLLSPKCSPCRQRC